MHWFRRALLSISKFLTDHHRATVIAFLCLTLFLGLQIPKIQFELNIYDIEDPNFESTTLLHQVAQSFDDGYGIVLLFFPRPPLQKFSQRQVCLIRDWLEGEARKSLGIKSTFAAWDLRFPQLTDSRLLYPKQLDLDCFSEAPVDLNFVNSSPWKEKLTNKSATDILATVEFRPSQNKTSFGRFDPSVIGQLVEDFKTHLGTHEPQIGFLVNGDASFQWHFKKMLRDDGLLNLLVVGMIFLFFRVFYGTWKLGALFIGSLVVTSVLVYGAMAWIGTPVDLLTNNLFLMTCIAGIEDFLFVAFHLRSQAVENRTGQISIEKSCQALILGGFFTSFTTILGFGSLGISDLRVIRRFGFWASWSAFVEWAVIFFLIPSFAKSLGQKVRWVAPAVGSRFSVLTKLESRKLGKGLVKLSLLPFVFGIYGFFHLNYEDSPSQNFPQSHLHSRSFKYLSQSRGWEGAIELVFDRGAHPDFGPLRSAYNVQDILSPVDVLNYFKGDLPEIYSGLVAREISVSPLFDYFYSRRGKLLRVPVYLKSIDLSELEKTFPAIDSFCKSNGCSKTGQTVVFNDYSDHVSKTLVESFLVSLFLLIGSLLMLSRAFGIKNWKFLIYSTLWCPVTMMGILWIFQVPINLMTSIFAAVIVGLTGDNVTQFICASSDGDLTKGVGERAGATVQLTIFLCLCSLIFLGFTLVPMKILGLLFFVGFALTLVGDLWLLRSLGV